MMFVRRKTRALNPRTTASTALMILNTMILQAGNKTVPFTPYYQSTDFIRKSTNIMVITRRETHTAANPECQTTHIKRDIPVLRGQRDNKKPKKGLGPLTTTVAPRYTGK